MAVYWVGADGNVWFKGSSGVRNVGKPISATSNGFDTNQISAEATRISDPNPPRQSAPVSSGGGGGGGGGGSAAPKVDKSSDIALNNAALGSLDSQTATGISSVDKALSGLYGQYDIEKGTNEGSYQTNSDQNQNNLQKNKQTALVNAAAGRQGLNGTLASLGALNGTGIQLADRAVQKGANDDLSGADDNYASNQSGLDTSIGQFRQEDDRRRKEAATAAENAKTNINNDAAKSRLGYFTNIANDYSAQGDAGNAKKYSDLASSLFPTIAATSIPDSNIAYQGAAFTPANLATYLAGANPTTVDVTNPAPGASTGLIATSQQNKKKQLQAA